VQSIRVRRDEQVVVFVRKRLAIVDRRREYWSKHPEALACPKVRADERTRRAKHGIAIDGGKTTEMMRQRSRSLA